MVTDLAMQIKDDIEQLIVENNALKVEAVYWERQFRKCLEATKCNNLDKLMSYPRTDDVIEPSLLVTDAIDSLRDFYADEKRVNKELVDALEVLCKRLGVSIDQSAEDAARKMLDRLAELEASSRDTYPKGRDGEPIKYNDLVFGEDGKGWLVRGWDYTKAPYTVIAIEQWNHGNRKELKPSWLTHERPENAMAVIHDMSAELAKRCGASTDEFEVMLCKYKDRIEALGAL